MLAIGPTTEKSDAVEDDKNSGEHHQRTPPSDNPLRVAPTLQDLAVQQEKLFQMVNRLEKNLKSVELKVDFVWWKSIFWTWATYTFIVNPLYATITNEEYKTSPLRALPAPSIPFVSYEPESSEFVAVRSKGHYGKYFGLTAKSLKPQYKTSLKKQILASLDKTIYRSGVYGYSPSELKQKAAKMVEEHINKLDGYKMLDQQKVHVR